jgi:hypothetical protein
MKSSSECCRLVIRASVKSHLKDFIYLSWRLSWEPEYPFVLNIDGQAVTWRWQVREDSPEYDGGAEDAREGRRE